MIICHISSMHSHDDGRIFQRACSGLAKAGHRVFYITTYNGTEVINGVEVIGIQKRNGIKRRIFSSFEAYKRVSRIQADIFHFHDPDLIPWMILLTLSGRKIIYDIHENYEARVYKLPFPGRVNNLLAKVYRRLENFIINRFSGAVVVTGSMKELLSKVKKPVIVIDNLVSVNRLKNEEIEFKKNPFYTIYTSGNNTPARNCMNLIEALPFIVKDFTNVKAQFVGRYHPENYKVQLKKRAEELDVSEYIELDGMLPWVENFKRTAKAHIGCVFYEDNPNNRVTLPNRLYEYMYCGVAVLGEDFPEVRRVVNDSECGLLVDSSSPKDIADKVLYLFNNPDEMIEMGHRGREAIMTKYNYETALESLQDFYSDILNKD